MKKEEVKSILTNIANLKKELLMMRIKISSGESVIVKDYKIKRKEIARLFTKLNANKE
jgi:ribosomal protein L29